MIRKEWLWSLVNALELSVETAKTDDEKMLVDLLTRTMKDSIEVVPEEEIR